MEDIIKGLDENRLALRSKIRMVRQTREEAHKTPVFRNKRAEEAVDEGWEDWEETEEEEEKITNWWDEVEPDKQTPEQEKNNFSQEQGDNAYRGFITKAGNILGKY